MTTEYDSKKMTKGLIRGNLPMILTGICLESGELYGYEAMQKIKKKFGTTLGPSSIYPQLDAMAKDGYFTTEWKVSNGQKPRKIYTPTQKARESVSKCRTDLTTLNNIFSNAVDMEMIVQEPQTIVTKKK